MRAETSPRRAQQPEKRVRRALWAGCLFVLFLVVIDYRGILIRPSSLRYALLLPPVALIALAAGRTAPLRARRPRAEDWLLLGLAGAGSIGGLYGKLVEHVPSPAVVAFGPMLVLGSLHLFVHEAPGERESARYLRILRDLLCLYVALHFLASSGLVPQLAAYDSYRFEKGFLIAMALVACILTRKYGRSALLVGACVVIFANYPAATYMLIGGATVVVVLLTARPRSRTGIAVGLVLVAASFAVYATTNGAVKSTAGYFQSVGKQDNSNTRIELWHLAIQQIDHSPVVGHFFTNDLSLSVPISLTGFTRVEPHNDYLQVAMLGGFVALGVYLAWILLAIRRSLRTYRRLLSDGREESALLVRVLLVGFVGFFVMSIVNPGLSVLGLSAPAFVIHSLIRTFDAGPPEIEAPVRRYASASRGTR